MVLNLLKRVRKVKFKRINQFIQKRPLLSFFSVLIVLFGLILAGNFLTPKKPEITKAEVVKEVAVYQLGSVPKISLQAKVDKSGVINVVALAPGVVSTINVTEGQQVQKGANLVNFSTNYSGGNAANLQLAVAAKQNQIVKDTYQIQKELIKQNREIVHNSLENVEGLREISSNSLSGIRGNLTLNQSIIDQIDSNIRELQANNPGGVNDQTILQSRQMKSQFEAANLGLRNQLNTVEFSTKSDGPVVQLSELQKDIALKQLDIQEKTLDLTKDISSLQVALAAVNAEMLHPTAPFGGTVDKIFVKVGEAVNPGTPLLIISGNNQRSSVVALVPENIAKNVSKLEEATLKINGANLKVQPAHISQDATDGVLYSVIFNLPDEMSSSLTLGNYVLLELPVGLLSSGNTTPYVPLDSVFQGSDMSYVFVVQGDKAESRKVELGSVFGRFVEVNKGLNSGDRVILNRNVIAGDKVKLQ